MPQRVDVTLDQLFGFPGLGLVPHTLYHQVAVINSLTRTRSQGDQQLKLSWREAHRYAIPADFVRPQIDVQVADSQAWCYPAEFSDV